MNKTHIDSVTSLQSSRKDAGISGSRVIKNSKTSADLTQKSPAPAVPNQRLIGSPGGAQLARIVSLRDGNIYIDFDGNNHGTRVAKTTFPLRNVKDEVLVVFLSSGEPIIVGQIYSSGALADIGGENVDVVIKGRRVRIETASEIVLVAGGTRIHLDARGKAIITADQVISRARGTNRVQGGNVQIN